jgi:hypothetical protein
MLDWFFQAVQTKLFFLLPYLPKYQHLAFSLISELEGQANVLGECQRSCPTKKMIQRKTSGGCITNAGTPAICE